MNYSSEKGGVIEIFYETPSEPFNGVNSYQVEIAANSKNESLYSFKYEK